MKNGNWAFGGYSFMKGASLSGRSVKRSAKAAKLTPRLYAMLRQLLVVSAVIAICAAQAYGANRIHSLFSDHRAMRVGDILTVIIIEQAKAGSESATNTATGSEVELRAGAMRLPNNFGASAGAAFNGQGATSRSGSLSATVTARVIEVLESGNLLIEGSKVVEINQEREIIKITGIVRPQDIQKNNILYSTSIADAEITYSGNGTVNAAQKPGIFSRIFNWLF